MATSLIVRNLDEELVRKLKIRAAHNGRSAEAEHREILKQVLERGDAPMDVETFKELAARVRAMTRGREHTPSEVLLRESRDER